MSHRTEAFPHDIIDKKQTIHKCHIDHNLYITCQSNDGAASIQRNSIVFYIRGKRASKLSTQLLCKWILPLYR